MHPLAGGLRAIWTIDRTRRSGAVFAEGRT